MPIIAIAGQKGGVGKTNTAIQIAAEWERRGTNILLVDADPQGSSVTWGSVAKENKHSAPDVVAIPSGLEKKLPPLSKRYDITVIDCPPRLGELQAFAAALSDVVILPCGPSALDIWALLESIENMQEIQKIHPELVARILITHKKRGTIMSREIRDSLEEVPFEILDCEIGHRVTYPESVNTGQGVVTYSPRSIAAKEIRELVDELDQLLTNVTSNI